MRFIRMKILICYFGLLIVIVPGGPLFAQRGSGSQQLVSWAEHITVDGHLEDWGDTLLYEYTNQNLQYEIKNDDANLYVAMRVRDKDRQLQVLSQGFSFMVNVKGRKREGPTLVYPIADRLSFRSIMSADNENRPEDMRIGALQAIRAIYVLRFDDILDGQISLENQYGIQAGAVIDSTDALCFEAVIPLERLGLSYTGTQPLAFNVKVNGMIMPAADPNTMRRSTPYGYGYPYGYGQNTQARPREEAGKWIVSPLASRNQ